MSGDTTSTVITVSPSSLGRWLDCPRRYRLQDVERHPVTVSWAHFSLGNAVHAALRDWVDLAPHERTVDAVVGLLAQHWRSDGFRDAAQSADVLALTSQSLARYVESTPVAGEPHSRERTVSFRTTHGAITGRLDRLDVRQDADGEHLVVVDYKTGRRPPHEDEARTSMALAIYVAGVRRMLKSRCFRVELHHVPTGTVIAHDHDDASLERQWARVDAITAEVVQAVHVARSLRAAVEAGEVDAITHMDVLFPAHPGPLCAWCPMHPICPEGQTMGPMVQPWAGVLPEDGLNVPDQSD